MVGWVKVELPCDMAYKVCQLFTGRHFNGRVITPLEAIDERTLIVPEDEGFIQYLADVFGCIVISKLSEEEEIEMLKKEMIAYLRLGKIAKVEDLMNKLAEKIGWEETFKVLTDPRY